MLLVEYTILDKLQVINETTEGGQKRLKLRGRFQKCDEQNNNGRIYPRKILESQVQKIQEKINDRSLVGALDHPANDAIHLSQASHLITGLSVDKSGDVIGECEILSTPNGKIVEALINDGVKIGISSRGVGSVSEGREGKIVNEDFKLITFDLVSDPSTKGAYPELTESIRENSQRAQEIISKHKKDRVLITMLESKINEAMEKKAGKTFEYHTRKPKKAPKPKPKPTGKYESHDNKDDILEAFKKVCWGARKDERSERAIANKKARRALADRLGGGDRAQGRAVLRANPRAQAPAPNRNAMFSPEEIAGSHETQKHAQAQQRQKKAKKENTDVRAAVIEGFKRACWGDRYDEIGGGRALAGAPKVPASARPANPAYEDEKAKQRYRKEFAAYAKKFQKPEEKK